MAKSIHVNVKRRGRPATGQDPVSAVRLPKDVTAAIDAWAKKIGLKSRSEAIRQLVELGLTVKPRPKQSAASGAARAKELAAKAIDKLLAASTSDDDQATRKRRLLKGPVEFREDRVDRPKPKGK